MKTSTLSIMKRWRSDDPIVGRSSVRNISSGYSVTIHRQPLILEIKRFPPLHQHSQMGDAKSHISDQHSLVGRPRNTECFAPIKSRQLSLYTFVGDPILKARWRPQASTAWPLTVNLR